MTKTHAAMVWDSCLRILRDNLSDNAFATWFEPTSALSLEENTLTIQVKSAFYAEYIDEHYLDVLRQTLHKVIGPGARLNYKVMVDQRAGKGLDLPSSTRGTTNQNEMKSNTQALQNQQVRKAQVASFNTHLNEQYSFDTFIDGYNNKLPRSVAGAVAERPGQTFNPLFLYGPSGVGKTHLANAIGLQIREDFPQKRVLYVSAHLFQVQFSDAARSGRVNDFINFYQSIDVLILDDVQEFTGIKTQNTFFHIFNHLHQNGRQLILTSDRAPVQLQGFEDRLLTRFKWSMVTEMERPTVELRKEILRDKVQRDGNKFPEDVIDFIAENVSDNVRDLEGIVTSIIARSTFQNRPVTVNLAQKVVSGFVDKQAKVLTQDDIIDVVYDFLQVDRATMLQKNRKQELVKARYITMYMLKEFADMSYSKIGKLFKKNHTTVMHGVDGVKGQMEVNPTYRSDVEQIISKIKSAS